MSRKARDGGEPAELPTQGKRRLEWGTVSAAEADCLKGVLRHGSSRAPPHEPYSAWVLSSLLEHSATCDSRILRIGYAGYMNHLEVLREKIGLLRVEIAEIQELNERYRRQERNEPQAQVAHGQRQERLQAIQQELSQLAGLGRKVRSIEEMKEEHRARLHPVKQVS